MIIVCIFFSVYNLKYFEIRIVIFLYFTFRNIKHVIKNAGSPTICILNFFVLLLHVHVLSRIYIEYVDFILPRFYARYLRVGIFCFVIAHVINRYLFIFFYYVRSSRLRQNVSQTYNYAKFAIRRVSVVFSFIQHRIGFCSIPSITPELYRTPNLIPSLYSLRFRISFYYLFYFTSVFFAILG